MILFIANTILQLVDLFATYYYVYVAELATEKNPFITSIESLVIIKMVFLAILYIYYLYYEDTTHYTIIMSLIAILYIINIGLSLMSLV
jgi:hypothetical protein